MKRFFEIHGIFASFAFAAFVAFLAVPQNLKAEQSGWFVGVQAGYGLGDRHRELEARRTIYGESSYKSYTFTDIQKHEKITNEAGQCRNTAAGTYGPCTWGRAGTNMAAEGIGYRVIQTYSWDPTDNQSTWKSVAGTQLNNILNYIPGGSIYNTNTQMKDSTRVNGGYLETIEANDRLKGLNAGLLAGYKHFFSTKFGLRVYGLLDYSYYKGSDSAALQKMQAYNANLNLDVLYNLVDKNDKIMGVFAGLSVGGAQYISSKTRLASDIDIGLNFGLRFGAGKHSIELFSRIGGLFVGAEHYGTSDTAYESGNIYFHTRDSTSSNQVRVCPVSETNCNYSAVATLGYEQGNGTNDTTYAQYRYAVYRIQTDHYYNRHTVSSPVGSSIMDSYKQPYKVGIRYIYSF